MYPVINSRFADYGPVLVSKIISNWLQESASQRHAAEKCRATAAVLMSVSAEAPEGAAVLDGAWKGFCEVNIFKQGKKGLQP